MKRRTFLARSSAGALAGLAPCTTELFAAEESASIEVAEGTGGPVIDVHQHINFHGRLNADFVAHQRRMGVGRTVLLPSGVQIAKASTHMGRSNGLAARVFGTEANARFAAQYPDEFIFFCNEVPDLDGAQQALERSLERGAAGIGELKFGLDCDSEPMQRVYEIARDFGVPVLLHFEHGKYNMGFDRFHRMLEKYPTVNFFGHAQTWWGNIDADHQQEVMYPKTPVKAGGLTDRYLADYPNLFGDLSAGSGQNSLKRDLEHAAAFLDRHQDKICYGTDCPDTAGHGDKCSGSGTRDLIVQLVEDEAVRDKIFRSNARRAIPALAEA